MNLISLSIPEFAPGIRCRIATRTDAQRCQILNRPRRPQIIGSDLIQWLSPRIPQPLRQCSTISIRLHLHSQQMLTFITLDPATSGAHILLRYMVHTPSHLLVMTTASMRIGPLTSGIPLGVTEDTYG